MNDFYRRRGKRLFDLTASCLGLVVLAPIFALVSLLVLCGFGRPILFRQRRPGIHGQPFTILKFRTMTIRTNEAGTLLPDAQRLTLLGKFLRATSLDELPELINVLKGEMSLVGPRPWLMEYIPLYSPKQFRRHEVLPGITGWAQVNGRNALAWEDRFKLDVWYVDHFSLKLDLKILCLTVLNIIKRKDINEPGQATAAPFTG